MTVMIDAPAATGSKEQILVLHQGGLGETVLMLAGARQIREAHRKARITLLTGPEFEPLLKHCPYFDAVEASLADAAGKNFLERVKRARASRFDRVYDLGAGEASGKLKRAMNFASGKWVSAAPDARRPGHPLDQQAAALAKAGASLPAAGTAAPPTVEWIDLLARRSRTLEPAYFGIQGRYALFAPVGEDAPVKGRWPAERWAELSAMLAEADIEPVVVGGPAAREAGRAIARLDGRVRDATGRANLVQLAGLGRKACCVFGERSGLVDLMVAAGAPGVVVHPGAAPDGEIAPRGPEAVIVVHAETLEGVAGAAAAQAMRVIGGFDRRFEAA